MSKIGMGKMKWPQLALIALLCAGVGGVLAAFLMRGDSTEAPEKKFLSAARVERVDGEVNLDRLLEDDGLDTDWEQVTPNTPLTAGDRLYAGADSAASVAFTGRNFARLNPETSLDVLAFSPERTQLALRDGSAIFDLSDLDEDEYYEIATPRGAFELRERGLYEVGLNEDGSAWVSVLSGLAQVVGLAGSGQVGKGEVLTLLGQTAADVILSRVSPDYAGGLLDDYYAYQYPDIYDGRYSDYNAYLNDPYYYDPYGRYDSYRYVSDTIPGVRDLDLYGSWNNLDGYGAAWSPNSVDNWAPYREGYWAVDDTHGLTWVSNEPWGYAPYHYGRWVNSDGRWYWIPEGTNAEPSYAPALVAFLPLNEAGQIGWVPLAPNDPYVPTYYGADWQPHYLSDIPVVQQQVFNLNVPGAVTVVSADNFSRVIEPELVMAYDAQRLAGVRPVLDPLSVGEVRGLALGKLKGARAAKVSRELDERLEGIGVVASAPPEGARFGRDVAKAMRVQAVPDEQRKQKLRFADERRASEGSTEMTERGRGRQARAAAERASEVRRNERQAARQQQEVGREPRRQPRENALDAPRVMRGPARAAGEGRGRPVEIQRPQGERVGSRQNARGGDERPRAFPRGGGGGRAEAGPPRVQRQPPGQARRQQSASPQPAARQQQGPQAKPGKGGGGGGGGGKAGGGGGGGKGKGKN
jgi:hypothetical protein